MDEQKWLKEIETDCNYAFWKQLLAWQFFKVHLLFLTFEKMFGRRICWTRSCDFVIQK